MVLPSSGTISFSQLQTELGGTHPISMTEYYGGDSVTGNIPPSGHTGSVSMSNFHGAEAAFATALLRVSTNASGSAPSFSGTVDCSGGPAGQTWAVIVWRAGQAGAQSIPTNTPVVNGTTLTLRASRTTYYSDDGSGGACWASQITPSSSVSFSWTPNAYGPGYSNNNGWQLWIVRGVDSLLTTINYPVYTGGSQTFNYNNPYCIIVGGGQAKGSGSLGSNFDTKLYGCGGDTYAIGSVTAGYGSNQSTCGVVLSYGTNNALIT